LNESFESESLIHGIVHKKNAMANLEEWEKIMNLSMY
jgi:hypothetical protein